MTNLVDPRLAFIAGAIASALAIQLANVCRRKELILPKHCSEAPRDVVCVTPEELNSEALITAVGCSRAGAIVTFSGVTRDNFNGKRVIRLE